MESILRVARDLSDSTLVAQSQPYDANRGRNQLGMQETVPISQTERLADMPKFIENLSGCTLYSNSAETQFAIEYPDGRIEKLNPDQFDNLTKAQSFFEIQVKVDLETR